MKIQSIGTSARCGGVNLFTLLVVAILGSGCIPSLHPLYDSDEDIVTDDRILGTWHSDDGRQEWTFAESAEKGYTLTIVDAQGSGVFDAHLVQVWEDGLFLDLFPSEPPVEGSPFYQMHWLNLHSFIWVQEIEPGLKLAVLHPNWLKKHVAEHPDAIGHEQARDGVMFTDHSSALQSFLEEVADIPDAFHVMDPLVPAAK